MKKLFAIAVVASLIGIVRWIAVTQGATPNSESDENYDSPRLAALAKQLTGWWSQCPTIRIPPGSPLCGAAREQFTESAF